MPLSDFFSRRNNNKQLRTDGGTIEQYLCRPTEKKVIGPIIKKTVIRKIRYIAMQGTCQCHLVRDARETHLETQIFGPTANKRKSHLRITPEPQ